MEKPGIAGTEVWDAAKRENPELSDHLRIHKPYIDAVTYDSPRAPGARMRRVGEVMDLMLDTGARVIWVGIPNDDSAEVTARLALFTTRCRRSSPRTQWSSATLTSRARRSVRW